MAFYLCLQFILQQLIFAYLDILAFVQYFSIDFVFLFNFIFSNAHHFENSTDNVYSYSHNPIDNDEKFQNDTKDRGI